MNTYGIEIEFTCRVSIYDVAQALQNAGVACEAEGYNHSTRSHWKVVTDASVRGGYEVVSPILNDNNFESEIKKVCEGLASINAGINQSCGLHVHHGARDLTVETAKNLVKMYKANESHIDSFMPRSRRDNNNQYVRTLEAVSVASIESADDLRDVSYAMGTRYRKINLESFWRHGTVEFRHHSGTVEASKIINWVKLTRAMLNVANEREMGRAANLNEFLNNVLGSAVDSSRAVNPRAGSMLAEAKVLFDRGHSNESVLDALKELFPEAKSLNLRRMNQFKKKLFPVAAAVNNSELVEFFMNRAANFAA